MGEEVVQRFRCKQCKCPVGRWMGGGWKHFATPSRKSCGKQPIDSDIEALPSSTLRCSACHEEKPVSEYYQNRHPRSTGRGRSYTCKLCITARYNTEQRRQAWRLYAERNPEKTKARQVTQYVQRKPNCESCGSADNLHKHHLDYSKPLEIITLCRPCHERAHHG